MSLTRANAKQYVDKLKSEIPVTEQKLTQARINQQKASRARQESRERMKKAEAMRDTAAFEHWKTLETRDNELVEKFSKEVEKYEAQLEEEKNLLARARRLLRSGQVTH